jgi:hypothetical protein
LGNAVELVWSATAKNMDSPLQKPLLAPFFLRDVSSASF